MSPSGLVRVDEPSAHSSRVILNKTNIGVNPINRTPLFSGLSSGELSAIVLAARVRMFARGQILYLEGEAVRQVILLTSGVVKTTGMGLGGAEVILGLRVPGDVLGAAGRHRTTAQAFRLCRTLVWDAAVFEDLVERLPVVRENMIEILSGELHELEERFREVASEKAERRVASQIIRLAEKIGVPVEAGREIGISREDLAQMTGTTMFTVSRFLSVWEARGIVLPRRQAVVIRDLASLREVSGFSG